MRAIASGSIRGDFRSGCLSLDGKESCTGTFRADGPLLMTSTQIFTVCPLTADSLGSEPIATMLTSTLGGNSATVNSRLDGGVLPTSNLGLPAGSGRCAM